MIRRAHLRRQRGTDSSLIYAYTVAQSCALTYRHNCTNRIRLVGSKHGGVSYINAQAGHLDKAEATSPNQLLDVPWPHEKREMRGRMLPQRRLPLRYRKDYSSSVSLMRRGLVRSSLRER